MLLGKRLPMQEESSMIETFIRDTIAFLVPFVELAGALVVLGGVGRSFYHFLRTFIKKADRHGLHTGPQRIESGQYIIMGLEFQVAADVLKTAISPNWNDIGLLAALIGLRSVLNYLLERDLHRIEQEERDWGNWSD